MSANDNVYCWEAYRASDSIQSTAVHPTVVAAHADDPELHGG